MAALQQADFNQGAVAALILDVQKPLLRWSAGIGLKQDFDRERPEPHEGIHREDQPVFRPVEMYGGVAGRHPRRAQHGWRPPADRRHTVEPPDDGA